MEDHNQHRPLGKELAIVIAFVLFVIYLIAGGLAHQHGYFDGTIMTKLFPAMAFGYVSAMLIGFALARYYPYGIPVWIIGGLATFALVTYLEMIDFRFGRYGFGALLTMILIVVRIVVRIILHIVQKW